MTGINRKQPILEVRHADLTRASSDSPYRSFCPVCKKGVLMMGRDRTTFSLTDHDRCLLCGQQVRYTDIENMRVLLDGELPPPKMTLNLVAQEIRCHAHAIGEQIRYNSKGLKNPPNLDALTLLDAAQVLVSMVDDGMANQNRATAVKQALEILMR